MALLETARLELPLLAAGQAHKELFHNAALARIDFLIHPVVQAIETDPTTITPVAGQSWLVGSGATDDWLDHDDQIAGWSGNGWQFFSPLPSMRVYIESADNFAIYRESWQLAIEVGSPVAGSFIDAEARGSIDSILTALEAHGILKFGT
ncbi:DUF2793 domain-containing protein [Parasphingorhabdus sp.]|uniref:DUF2793 domain-containing protein n=1 Tax=Parasphingorhabdus sp. TaxID=2709688 RepID=UPI003001FF88